jgi:hypothetical protein
MAYFWVLFPSLLASAVATVETLYPFPRYVPRLVDLLYAAIRECPRAPTWF